MEGLGPLGCLPRDRESALLLGGAFHDLVVSFGVERPTFHLGERLRALENDGLQVSHPGSQGCAPGVPSCLTARAGMRPRPWVTEARATPRALLPSSPPPLLQILPSSSPPATFLPHSPPASRNSDVQQPGVHPHAPPRPTCSVANGNCAAEEKTWTISGSQVGGGKPRTPVFPCWSSPGRSTGRRDLKYRHSASHHMFPEPDGKREVGRGKSGVGVRTTVSFTHPPALLYASTSPRERTLRTY